ncbi:hypothetical protein V8C42DRAFT_348992 [Trichoderma barbatum]
MLYKTFIAAVLGLARLSVVNANFPIPDSDFRDVWKIAALGSPDFHFGREEACYPTAALYADGTQHRPGIVECPPKNHELGGRAHDFPTYFRVRYCNYGDHDEYHVMYSLYTPWDTVAGHDHDWEWAVLKYLRWSQDRNYWVRSQIVLEHHGDKQYFSWADYPNTVTVDNRNWRREADNAVIFVGEGMHGFYPSPPFPDIVDQWYWAADWLINAEGFPKLKWGSATSSPDTFEAGGSNDLCWVV